jgi:hypothetical protein
MDKEIKLDTVEEVRAKEEENTLPKGVRAMVFGENLVFVHKVQGLWMPLPEEEQEVLRSKHVV